MPRIVLFALCFQKNYSIHSRSLGLLDFYCLLLLDWATVKSSSVAISCHSGSNIEKVSFWKSLLEDARRGQICKEI